MKNVVITGVSTGIGYGLTRELVKNGFRVFGSVRRDEDASRLSQELGELYVPLLFDITDESGIADAAKKVADVIGEESLFALVNNAGISVSGPLLHIPLKEFRHQFEVNLFGHLGMIQAFAPMLGAYKGFLGKPGRIMMMSSIAGRLGLPFLGPYAASKHAMEGFSDSLRRELQLYGIKVIILEPGPIQTEIWYKVNQDRMEAVRKSDYARPVEKFAKFVEEGKKGMALDDFSKRAFKILTNPNPKTRYVITPSRLKNWTLPKLLPDSVFDKVIASQIGLKRENL